MATSVILATASLCVAFCSSLISFWSARTSRRALRLAESQSLERTAGISLYLIEGFRYRIDDPRYSLSGVAFSLTATNTSSQPNSIVSLNLRLSCIQKDGRAVEYIIPHTPEWSDRIKGTSLSAFQCPVTLGPKAAISKWVLFADSKIVPTGAKRESYTVQAIDTQGRSVQISALIIPELANESCPTNND